MISRGYSSWSAQTGERAKPLIPNFSEISGTHTQLFLTRLILLTILTIATTDRVVAIISRPAVKSASETGHNIFVLSGHEESF